MLLDYEYSRKNRKFNVSYIKEDGQKGILKFDNISRFKQFVYDEKGKYPTWDDKKCSVRWTDRPEKFDLKEFLDDLPDEQRKMLEGTTFPKLYTFDIENEFEPGSDAQENAKRGDKPITTISIVSPNFNCAVLGTTKMDKEGEEWVNERFKEYLGKVSLFKELKGTDPKFRYVYFEEEEDMLRFFMQQFIAKVPIAAGWNSILYDWQYFTNRVKNYFPNLSLQLASYTETTRNKRYTDLKGEDHILTMPCHTLILDYMQVIKDEDKTVLPMKESLMLDYVSHETLGCGKIEYDGDLEQLRNSDYKKYVFYNSIDSILVQLIDRRFRTMDHIYVFSIYCKEKIGDCFSKIACSESLCFEDFRKHGLKVPQMNYERPEERGRVQGAYVKQPIPGIWKSVSCNDFASLYPSTIRSCNLSFENFYLTKHDEEKLSKYRKDPKYVVIESSVFENEGTIDNPEAGKFVGTFVLDDELEPYRKDPNYFVSLNGSVYKNDKDYCLKRIQTYLYEQRNAKKYVAKDLDAFVITDIDHILENSNKKLFDYQDNVIEALESIGYKDIRSGKDLKGKPEDWLKGLKHKVIELIEYDVTLEQSIKILMNSIYGGTSNVANCWFNIHLAGDITGESRNLTHLMERHFRTFWNENWENMKEWHKKWNIEVNYDSIPQIIENSPTKSLVTTVYGDTDSSSFNTIIHTNCGDMTIEELYNKNEHNQKIITHNGNELVECSHKVLNWNENKGLYYGDVNYIMRHKVRKPKWKIKTKSGKEVIVTNDHSMVVFRNGKQTIVKPYEILQTDKVLVVLN